MNSQGFSNFLNSIQSKPLRVLNASILSSEYIPIDLSKNNSDLNNFDIYSSTAWQEYMDNYLQKNNKTVAFGGYLEQRTIYKRSRYFNKKTRREKEIYI